MPTASNPGLPVQPTTVQDTRLPSQFINDLVLKVLYLNGSMSGKGLSEHTCLAWPIIEEALKALSEDQFCQATGARDHTFTGGDFNAGIFQGLTNAGVAKAKELILVSQYAGPAPITMDYYMAVSKAQAKNHYRVTRPQLEAALAKLILPPQCFRSTGSRLGFAPADLSLRTAWKRQEYHRYLLRWPVGPAYLPAPRHLREGRGHQAV